MRCSTSLNVKACERCRKNRERKQRFNLLFAQNTRVSVSIMYITVQKCKRTTEQRTHCEWNMFVYISFRVRALACSITHSCNSVYGRKILARPLKKREKRRCFRFSSPTPACVRHSPDFVLSIFLNLCKIAKQKCSSLIETTFYQAWPMSVKWTNSVYVKQSGDRDVYFYNSTTVLPTANISPSYPLLGPPHYIRRYSMQRE